LVGPRATDEGKPAADVAWESRRVEDEAIEEALRAEEEARAIREGGGGQDSCSGVTGYGPRWSAQGRLPLDTDLTDSAVEELAKSHAALLARHGHDESEEEDTACQAPRWTEEERKAILMAMLTP
jgi:hypothetical protein